MNKVDIVANSGSDTNGSDSFSTDDFRISEDMTSISVISGRKARSKNYLIGKKYFELVLAQMLTVEQFDDGFNTIDSLQERSIRQYPYLEAVEHLRHQGLIQSTKQEIALEDSYEALMVFVGGILERSNPSEECSLKKALQKYSGDNSIAGLSFSRLFGARQARTTNPSSDGQEIGHYTSMLKEHADKLNTPLRYEVNTITLVPPLFEAVLYCYGHEFTAKANTKKLAKHKASKEACERMMIGFK